MATAANDQLSPRLEAALIHFYSLIAKDEARASGAPFSIDASRQIAQGRGIDLANALPSRSFQLMRLAVAKTFKARGLECVL